MTTTRILVQSRYTRSTYYTYEHIGCRFHEIMFVLAGSTFLFVRVKDIYMSYSEKNGKRRRENYGSNWKTPTRYIIYLVRIIARTYIENAVLLHFFSSFSTYYVWWYRRVSPCKSTSCRIRGYGGAARGGCSRRGNQYHSHAFHFRYTPLSGRKSIWGATPRT